MKKKLENWLHLIISTLLLLAIGGLAGYAWGFFHATVQQFPEIQIVEDTNEGVATIQFAGIEKGELRGQVTGRKARIVYGKDQFLILEPGNTFGIPVPQSSFKTSASSVNTPADALFVASKRGKYYYSVSDPKAQELAPKNQIYFKSKEEAEKKGYKTR